MNGSLYDEMVIKCDVGAAPEVAERLTATLRRTVADVLSYEELAGEDAMEKVRMSPDEVIPHVQHVLDLVLEHVARHPEITLVFTGEEDRLLEQIQVFHPERRLGRIWRAVTIARHLARLSFGHLLPPLRKGLPLL
jgi:hypothetical protein